MKGIKEMVTRKEYALLSWAAYKDNELPKDSVWKKMEEYSDATGCQATAFRNSETGEIVIAYRGTDSDLDWISGNAPVGTPTIMHKVPEQYGGAIYFYNSIKDKYQGVTISITGHSLGGILAQLVGACTLKETVTFNSIGVEHLLDNLDPPQSKSMKYSNIKNYSLENDALYQLHIKGKYQFLGESYIIPSTGQPGIDAHKNIFAAGVGEAYLSDEWTILNNNTVTEKLGDTFTEAEEVTVPKDPLLIDLDGDGIETTTLENGVYFDHESDGFAELSA